MFITPHGSEEIQKATIAKLGQGVKFGEIIEGNNFEVALGGKTFEIKEQLKAAGFRFDGKNKVWYLPGGYPALRAFLEI